MAITINGNGITSANIADGAITLADLDSSISFSSSNLSSDFTVAAGKTVSAGTVANLYGGEIGTNPVANTLGTEQSYSAETHNHITGDGEFIVKAYSNSSGHHCVKVMRTSDGTQTADTTVYSGYTGSSTSLSNKISSNRFVVYGTQEWVNSHTTNACGVNFTQSTGYMYFVMIEVSSTGTVTYGNPWTHSATNAQYTKFSSIRISNLVGNNTNRAAISWANTSQTYCNGWNSSTSYVYKTFPINGSLNFSTTNTSSHVNSSSNWIINSAGNKLISPSTSTTWNVSDWNGSITSNDTTVTNNRTNLSSAQFIKPDPTQDKLLCFYINTNLELCVETLDWTASAINVVANSKAIIEADASGVSLGSIKGSTAGIGITYENGSKGRFKTLSLDSNMVVTGQSSVMTVNDSNVVPGLAYKGNDVFQVWNNNVDTYTRSVTVNAYSTSPLKPLGVITQAGSGGDSVSVVTRGVVGGFTGLTIDSDYYYDTSVYDGTVTTTNTGVFVGRAVSTTELLLTDLTEK